MWIKQSQDKPLILVDFYVYRFFYNSIHASRSDSHTVGYVSQEESDIAIVSHVKAQIQQATAAAMEAKTT